MVLAGPILRRVDHDSVTVWVALKEPCTVQLMVFDTDYRSLAEHSEHTKQFGAHLHILAVTVRQTGLLSPNQIYFYNLRFNGQFMIDGSGNLVEGIVTNVAYTLDRLTYKDHLYPSFVLPPDDLNHLKFAQGSCRKPHGGATDALRGLDTILEQSTRDRSVIRAAATEEQKRLLYLRPQFLCLTGDQIYADDVADGLLYMIMDAATCIMGWGNYNDPSLERLPRLTATLIRPGFRQAAIAANPNDVEDDMFSSSEAKSHLIRLGEFYMMYLFVWSDVLWPAVNDNYPLFDDLFPGETRVTTTATDSPRYALHLSEKRALQTFQSSLKKVRKALANTPTYMMFDDHDVTDDWFLTHHWTENTLSNEDTQLSWRVLVNALSAYAVFQSWGNKPNAFIRGSEGADILAALQSPGTTRPFTLEKSHELYERLLPQLTPGDTNTRLVNGPEWQFYIDFDKFRLLVLDTRTKRAFYRRTSAPTLISTSVLANRLHVSNIPADHELAVVVSPAPAFGHHKLETLQTVARFRGMYWQDQEAWVFNRIAFEAFLEKLSHYKRVIILSGDVHYSFSNLIRYWNFRPGHTVERAVMANLTCSSLKNSTESTANLGNGWGLNNLFSPLANTIHPEIEQNVVGWGVRGHQIERLTGNGWTSDYLPARASIPVETFEFRLLPGGTRERLGQKRLIPPAAGQDYSSDPPFWGYTIRFVGDFRDAALRGTIVVTDTSGRRHVEIGELDQQRVVNGHDNIGFIKITEWLGTSHLINHELWFTADPNDSDGEMRPHTIHTIHLNIPDAADIRPGEE